MTAEITKGNAGLNDIIAPLLSTNLLSTSTMPCSEATRMLAAAEIGIHFGMAIIAPREKRLQAAAQAVDATRTLLQDFQFHDETIEAVTQHMASTLRQRSRPAQSGLPREQESHVSPASEPNATHAQDARDRKSERGTRQPGG
jgi:hypothetical protein